MTPMENGSQRTTAESRSNHQIADKQICSHGNPAVGLSPSLCVQTPFIVLPVAWLDELIEREVARRLKDAAVAICNGLDWSKAASAPSYAELQRRRYDFGPLRPPIDRAAAARWVQTGSSEPEEAAA